MPNADQSGEGNGDEYDPYLLTFGQIAAELSAIRRELQADNNARPSAEGALATYDCQHCELAVEGSAVARTHAIEDHNAPANDWEMCYERE